MQVKPSNVFGVRREFIVNLVVIGVAINGLITILSTLFEDVITHHRSHDGNITDGLSLIIGLTLLYLSRLLDHRKRAALVVILPLYAFILAYNLTLVIIRASHSGHVYVESVLIDIVLPVIVVLGLSLTQNEFKVRSDIRSFGSSLRFIIIVLAIALFYGVIGFQLLDEHDFHQEISLGGSIHYTIDQFDLTTSRPLVAYTRRARIFVDSLSIISIGAVGYGLVSLFQPIKARFVDQTRNRTIMRAMLERNPANSEDFFKLWPHDKVYYITYDSSAGLAFHVRSGIALVVGDPAGNPNAFNDLLRGFDELCYVNDWTPAFIHTEPKYNKLYEQYNFSLQKLGEEAILDLDHFVHNVAGNKYFRNIGNKFTKAGYSSEVLLPPHNQVVLVRLKQISQEWLSVPGRSERGFIMGYFSYNYLQQCPIVVIRDRQGVIQAFINQVYSFDNDEANFDLLRHSQSSLGNINDFLLMEFIKHVHGSGFKRLNLGLCPLSGLEKNEQGRSVIDSALSFAYANGDRLYSFSGLHRFKAKYEPQWSSRYVAYRGGISGFTRVITALNRSWKVHFRN